MVTYFLEGIIYLTGFSILTVEVMWRMDYAFYFRVAFF